MSNCLRKTEFYTPKPGGGWHSSKGDSGVLFKLEVDLGRCKRVTYSDSSWRRQGYDSVWRDTGGSREDENCVKDPKRIKIVDAFLTHAAKAGAEGYFVENGRLVKKAPRTGWVMAGGELAPTEFTAVKNAMVGSLGKALPKRKPVKVKAVPPSPCNGFAP